MCSLCLNTGRLSNSISLVEESDVSFCWVEKKWRRAYHEKFCLLYSESSGPNKVFDLLKHIPMFMPVPQSNIPSTPYQSI